MTKAELLAEIDGLPFIKRRLGNPEYVDKDRPTINGVTRYLQNVLEFTENTAIRKNLFFYVVDEGTETEEAFHEGTFPVKTVSSKTDIVEREAIAVAAKEAQLTQLGIAKVV